VSPCVDILRKLSTKINAELGTEQGSKHTVPDLSKDLATLMKVLEEHNVYKVIHGRVVDEKDHAVPDVISVGMVHLSHGNPTNPIADFNEQFERLRERRKLTPVLEEDIDSDVMVDDEIPAEIVVDASENASVAKENNARSMNSPLNDTTDSEASISDAESDAASDTVIIDPDLESALMGSPTLQCEDEDDVALDMDGWDLDSEDSYDGTEDSEDGSEDESGWFDWT
jgi:hypothetical protein